MYEVVALTLFLAGLIVGLGAVTVIDVCGFLGRRSPYWSEVTVKVHHITKPLIWLGMLVAILGGTLMYWGEPLQGTVLAHAVLACVLVLNGTYLSFVVSPYLTAREREGRAAELLPSYWQRRIAASMVVSFIGWWSSVVLLAVHFTQ
jgi:hypothetical protein